MKKITKLFALALSSVLALSLFAGCGGGGQSGTGPDGDDPDKDPDKQEPSGPTLPELPTPETTVQSFSDQDVTLSLDGRTQDTMSVSESLFGVFLEDINYAGYLLDDNLIPNGSFETTNADKLWSWTAEGATAAVENADGVLKTAQYYGDRGVNANYVALSVTEAGGGLVSKGHQRLPIAVEKDVEYIFSAFVKSSAAANMTVKLVGADATYDEKTVSVKGGNTWVKYQLTLKPNATASKDVSFKLSFDAEGKYYLDGIQLETTKQTGGIKQYVYDAIEELGPKFIRFPGGCIIEGNGAIGGADTEVVYDWKNSVGAVQSGNNAGDDAIPEFSYTLVKDGAETTQKTLGEWVTRRQNGDLWGYDMEYGVGFLEFFELCENVGASAVPVLNCGYSCMGGGARNPQPLNGRHGKKVEDYIQDAIDLIEFAKGDTSTKWGAVRAALGHEEPFEMDYLGIGNEQYGNEYYRDCYEKFLQNADFKAALAKYSIKPIVGNGMFLNNCQNGKTKGTAQVAAEDAVSRGIVEKVSDFGVHDQHYYVNWTTLLENYNMYDSYDKTTFATSADTAYGVFVGEYSANDGKVSGFSEAQNQLIAALAEAAMMTSYERNGNVVELAAYAPMFGVANQSANPLVGGDDGANQWAVDMMYFTNTTIVRTANYYVQKLFMHNQGVSYLYRSKMTWADGVKDTFFFEGAANARKTFNKLYYVMSKSAEGDLLVKVVNVSGEAVKMNIDIANATSRGFAYVTELTNSDYKALNTLKNEAVKPTTSSIGWEGQSFGYEFKPYSLTILRIPTQA